MKLTVPTWLTLLRIVMIPVLIVVFYLPYQWSNIVATGVFAIAAITDWLDGWIARRYAQHSLLGAFLDPVADKLMVAIALFLIVQGHPTPSMAFWAAVIVSREIAVSALREWMAEIGHRAKVRVSCPWQSEDDGSNDCGTVSALFGDTREEGDPSNMVWPLDLPSRLLDIADFRVTDTVVWFPVFARCLA